MRIVTVPFVTVIELTAPCWTRSNRYKIKPLLISITSFLQEVLTATGRPVHTALSDGLFIVAQRRMEVNGFCGGAGRLGSGSTVHVAGDSPVIELANLLPVWGTVGGSEKGEAMIIGKKEAAISKYSKLRLPFRSVLLWGIGRSPSA